MSALAPVTDADGRLGFCNVLPGAVPTPNGPTWAQLAYNAGARMNRWEFRWDAMEPQPGSWDFTPNDAAVASSLSAGLSVEGILIGTPDWSVAPHQRPGNGLPRGLKLPIDDPNNLWATYVRTTVAHYAGKVASWEVWNEPDLQFFWTSSPEDYERLLSVAYRVIRATDPRAKVVMAGMVVPDFAFVSRVLDAAVRGDSAGRVPFDIAAWHAYGPAASLYTNLVHFRSVLDAHKISAPIWVTEDGFPASDPNGEQRQASYVLQSIAYAFAAGARKVFVYRESDDPTPKTWGLITAAGTPRAGYVAFQVAAHYFSHIQDIIAAPSAGLERFILYSPGRRVTMVWNRGQSDVTLTVPEGRTTAAVTDSSGNSTSVTAPAGVIKMVVPRAAYNQNVDPSNAVVGGPPVFLAEDTTPPAQTGIATFIPPVPGDRRRLVVINPTATAQSALLSAAGNDDERQVLEIPAHAVRTVDLDLLAGPGYGGAYLLQGAAVLPGKAVSNAASIDALEPATGWFAASTPDAVQVSNPSPSVVNVDVEVYDRSGHARGTSRFTLQPSQTTLWLRPRNAANTSLQVRAGSGIVVANRTAGGSPVVAGSRSGWYVVRPGKARFAIFNPGTTSAHVDVHFVHAPTVKGEQLRLGPHRSYVLSGHGAKVLMADATSGIVVSGDDRAALNANLTAQPLKETGLAAAGSSTRVDLFNPSTQVAHVTLEVVTEAGTKDVTRQIAPAQIYGVSVRKASGPPSGVLVHSDVPVVAAPAG